MPTHLVVMGVAGTGKTTVAERLAGILGLPMAEGDDFHPGSNRDKMSAGIPLVDDDRWPWLELLAAKLREWDKEGGAVLACSALKRAYRDVLRTGAPAARFLHLTGPAEVLAERMGDREGHFMPGSLLRSQLDTLEAIEPDEDALVLDVRADPDALVDAAVDWLR